MVQPRRQYTRIKISTLVIWQRTMMSCLQKVPLLQQNCFSLFEVVKFAVISQVIHVFKQGFTITIVLEMWSDECPQFSARPGINICAETACIMVRICNKTAMGMEFPKLLTPHVKVAISGAHNGIVFSATLSQTGNLQCPDVVTEMPDNCVNLAK
jgi:hypothetical protein